MAPVMQILLERVARHVHHHPDDDDDPHDGNDGNPTAAKATAMVGLFLASFIIGNLPIQLSRWFKWESDAKNNVYVKFLLGLGGGVLLCTTFIHLLPEVSENFERLDLTPDFEVPYAELLMCIGFFVMYLVEECVHVYLHMKEKPKNMTVLRRSLSIRRGEAVPHLEPSKFEKNLNGDPAHNHHADHSHVVLDYSATSTVAIIRGLLVVLALSIHELFEGLAVGLEPSPKTVWYMFGAVSAHKLVIAFCIGVELVTSGIKTYLVIIYVFTFAVVSPMGIGIGIVLSNVEGSSTDVVSVILQGLASGTLLYVVFFEILQADKKSGLKQYFAILIGFIVMFGITLLG
ncbi:zinc transporter ZIP1 isoform X1 [Leptinotarsa decemlineata]|uniref:zinc transporter ZIP1 isoform X1 n=2 Tax=Leptinotarsa decemlineata TaxID=7539 RepID=UPI003D30D086